MKKHPLAIAIGIGCLALFFACKKNTGSPSPRTIRYILYTKQDFSTVHDTIRFRLFMAAGNTTLFDSALKPMTVSAIPDSMHAIVVDKPVPPSHQQDKLQVGFLYSIDNVGSSWFLDSSVAGQTLKKVEYSFR